MRLRLLLALLLLGLGGCSSDDEADRFPNVVIVLVDELRADVLGASGHPFFQSPCIDRIADEGARFDQAFVVTSLCSPSRATVLTGYHTPQHGVRDICTPLDPSIETIGTVLKQQGYETAFIGKSHLNSDASPLPGFDRWFSFIGQGSYIDPRLNVDGVPVTMPGHMTDILTAEALRFLDARKRKKPFLLILSHLAAHTPWTAQERFAGLYADEVVPRPVSWDDDFSDQPRFLECRQRETYNPDGPLRYLDVLAGVEESTCQLLDALDAARDLDDTLLIFTSDNGYFLGEHRLGDKRAAYEESIRIPLHVRYPKWFAAGVDVEGSLALNMDIAPTVLRAAGLDASAALPGLLLQDLASGRAQRDRFLYLYYQDLCSGGDLASCTPSMEVIRTLDHALMDYPSPRTGDELYDLRADPFQMQNIINDPASADLVDSLRSELEVLTIEFAEN